MPISPGSSTARCRARAKPPCVSDYTRIASHESGGSFDPHWKPERDWKPDHPQSSKPKTSASLFWLGIRLTYFLLRELFGHPGPSLCGFDERLRILESLKPLQVGAQCSMSLQDPHTLFGQWGMRARVSDQDITETCYSHSRSHMLIRELGQDSLLRCARASSIINSELLDRRSLVGPAAKG